MPNLADDRSYVSPPENVSNAMLSLSTFIPVTPGFQLDDRTFARTPDGMIYVLGLNPDRLIQVTLNGTFAEIPTPGKGFQLARSPSGKLYGLLAQGVIQIFKDGKTKLLAGSDRPYEWGPNIKHVDLDGHGDQARFSGINKIAADDFGNVFVMSSTLPRTTIRKINNKGDVSTLTGVIDVSDRFNNFAGDNFAVDSHGNLYFGTLESVMRLSASNKLEQFAGGDSKRTYLDNSGATRQLTGLDIVRHIRVDGHDNVYIAEVPGAFFDGEVILKIPQVGVISTVLSNRCDAIVGGWVVARAAGCTQGLVDGSTDRQIFGSNAFDVDELGNIYFVDGKFQAIRKLSRHGALSTILRGKPFLPSIPVDSRLESR